MADKFAPFSANRSIFHENSIIFRPFHERSCLNQRPVCGQKAPVYPPMRRVSSSPARPRLTALALLTRAVVCYAAWLTSIVFCAANDDPFEKR